MLHDAHVAVKHDKINLRLGAQTPAEGFIKKGITMREKNQTIRGIYQHNPKGFGFVVPEGGTDQEDWFVPRGQGGGAWDGDAVALLPTDPVRHAGRVVSVARRANALVTGTLRREGRTYFLVPDSPRLTHTILLTGRAKGVSPGYKAAVSMVSYGTPSTPPMGALREVFGPGSSLEAAQAAILYHYNVSPEFPPQVEETAAALPQTVSAEELAGREDFRNWCVVTIDSQSAKDLDDAVSLTRDEQGRRVLGVHIADVSHYVQARSPLDQEALERGTSVYYVNHVAPMLPVALSNGICSLNPQVDRLTLSCLMTLDEGGQVVDHRIVQGVIRTVDRLNYDEVNELLDGSMPESGPLSDGAPQSSAVRTLVRELDGLAAQRRKLRRQRGALELSSSECYFVTDQEGRVVDIRQRQSGRGESLIEECMLLANETVARHLCDHALPGVFRVHEKPTDDKTQGLRHMVAPLGYDLKQGDGFHLQKLLDWAKDGPLEGAVSMMVLRSLMKARYDEKNLGHFGLGADYYCHFTSPIRRYPDLVVHRILTAALTGAGMRGLAAFTPQAARQSSERELAAQSAEREIEKLYMAQFMADKVGQSFEGVVSGATRFGVFVALASGVEGMVAVEALPADRWDFDPDTQTLTGAQTGTVYAFGKAVEVVCAAADPTTGKIDFTLPNVGMTPGISVQTKHSSDNAQHRLDNERGRGTCSKRSSKGFRARRSKRRGKR